MGVAVRVAEAFSLYSPAPSTVPISSFEELALIVKFLYTTTADSISGKFTLLVYVNAIVLYWILYDPEAASSFAFSLNVNSSPLPAGIEPIANPTLNAPFVWIFADFIDIPSARDEKTTVPFSPTNVRHSGKKISILADFASSSFVKPTLTVSSSPGLISILSTVNLFSACEETAINNRHNKNKYFFILCNILLVHVKFEDEDSIRQIYNTISIIIRCCCNKPRIFSIHKELKNCDNVCQVNNTITISISRYILLH